MKKILIRFGFLMLAVLLVNCNIFEPFHDEGNSDDVNVLVDDALAAFENGEYDKAIEIAKKGLAKDSLNADLLFLRAQCVMQKYEIDVVKVIQFFQSSTNSPSPVTGYDVAGLRKTVAGDTTTLFDFTEEELMRLFLAFSQVWHDMTTIMMLLENGSINQTQAFSYFILYSNDLFLSAGIANIFMGCMRILDNDATPLDFTLDPSVKFYKSGDNYSVVMEGLSEAEVRARINANLNYFKMGQRFLLYYYVSTLHPLNLAYDQNSNANWLGFLSWFQFLTEKINNEFNLGPEPRDPRNPLPFTVHDTPAGVIFMAGHTLYANLYDYVY
ncbi:tetratricopeptide repeat protein [candidate division KSB1 bacterium]|nr:tetratricopeptide repeat protein [candidate division KSB1 bacterium]